MAKTATSPFAPGELWLRRTFALACALLALWMLFRASYPLHPFQTDRINKDLGLWSLRFLFAALVLGPASRWLRAPAWRRWRRPLGLAAFAFAAIHTVHFLLYGRLWPNRMDLLVTRPYLTIGLIALILFVPLAVTSNEAAVRRLTPRRWRALHTLVYVVAVLSVAHEVMAYGPLMGEAGLYCGLSAALVADKIVRHLRPSGARAAPAATPRP